LLSHSLRNLRALEQEETAVDLILWRHAEADDARGSTGANDVIPDSERPLTERGRKHAEKMAEWLRGQHMKDVRVFCSPAKRAIETANALGLPVKVKSQLAVGATAADLLAAADWPDHGGAVILVGHQPALGRLASLLLAGNEADWTIKKAGVWWFTNRVRAHETQTVLRAVANP
jgi:phosphohistidine phosphatase